MSKVKLHVSSIIIVFNILFFQACKKEETNIDITKHKWKVTEITKEGSSISRSAKKSYILTFLDSSYTVNLDVNSCFGTYEISQDGNINLSILGCTKVCCDSNFAEDLQKLFPKMGKYSVRGNVLTLSGKGAIKLKKQ